MIDTLFTRRLFLSRGVQLLSVAATVPVFLDRAATVMAEDHPGKTRKAEHVLVVVQLAGGNDGLNTIIPVASDDYYKARPTLGIARDKALRLNVDFCVHPSAVGLKALYDAGYLAILHAVGYPDHNRSHFRSTDIWNSAEPETITRSGWLGRYCDACCCGEEPGGKPKPPDAATAIALAGDPPGALIGPNYVPLSFATPEALGFQKANSPEAKAVFNALNDPAPAPAPEDADHRPIAGAGPTKAETAMFIERSALNSRLYADRIKRAAASANTANYPKTAFAEDLRLVAQLIASDLPTRVYYVKLGGFDTHSGQIGQHARLMGVFGSGVSAFVDDLKALGHLDRVTLMTFSEFGRRVKENGSGTDHGEGAPLFVVGSRIKAGFHGTFPSLAAEKLHRGDVPYTTDFRSLYATVLKDWLAADDAKVLGGAFQRLDLFKA